MGMGDEILVIRRDVLFKDGDFEGFLPVEEKDFMKLILENEEYLVRTEELENDSTYQQPIPYVWIVNKKNKTVFIYQRDVTGNEGRLYNLLSGGVGGHVDKKELVSGAGNPIMQAMMREMEEETAMNNYPTPKIIGFLNLNHEVHAVHLGVVALAETEEDVKPVEDMKHGKFYSVDEVDTMFSSEDSKVEEWTKVSWPVVKERLLRER